ncbi:coat F domain-containing protein [Fontibacillus phaseoli]|uniref:Coat F domain-containing protein n=1 Tax=Fontibacillus phaseoli TaxID=1416533 RepID=A0A369B7C9_9BACL|nr:spore coat protein [Fontibacillus phaseoli]RCX17432.1 coat F domain-containing protein [Fontibacillus phaseoli]
MNLPSSTEQLPENDLLKIILADLRRTVREYTTATTESSCPSIRRTFAELTDSTLRLQGDLYMLLEQNKVYSAPASASRQEIDKKIQEAEQSHQKVHQFVQQRSAQNNPYLHPSNVSYHQTNVQQQNPRYI